VIQDEQTQGDELMQTMTRTLILTVLVAAMLSGCEDQMAFKGGQTPSPSRNDPSRSASYIEEETVTGDAHTEGRGAVDAAMEWADKYAKVAQELLYANKRIGELETDKKKLQTEMAALKAELGAYQRELNDANAMLSDMKKDLKEWRASVLGIRKEFLASQNSILLSQQKILELLGGEVGPRIRSEAKASGPLPDAEKPDASEGQSLGETKRANLASK
jgi:hypothetical protein